MSILVNEEKPLFYLELAVWFQSDEGMVMTPVDGFDKTSQEFKAIDKREFAHVHLVQITAEADCEYCFHLMDNRYTRPYLEETMLLESNLAHVHGQYHRLAKRVR